jgi:hypothetical protein
LTTARSDLAALLPNANGQRLLHHPEYAVLEILVANTEPLCSIVATVKIVKREKHGFFPCTYTSPQKASVRPTTDKNILAITSGTGSYYEHPRGPFCTDD